MLNFALILLLAGIGPASQSGATPPAESPGVAGAGITIAQLEQTLSANGRTRDSKLAAELAGLNLIERASSAHLAKWQAGVRGERTRQVLAELADESAFVLPPAPDLLPDPPPTAAAQQQILSLAADYVAGILPKLPDFSALRTTTRFEKATPQQMRDQKEQIAIASLGREKLYFRALGDAPAEGSPSRKLYFVDVTSTRVTYQNDREVGNRKIAGSADPSLSTSGEFGPILSVVMGDAGQGNISWDYWEQDANGRRLAVFRYSVPKEKSHYAVYYRGSDAPEFPAYHGVIAINPADGGIYRIVMLSEDPTRPASTGGIAVEYGPTEIGGKTYLCPQKSVAMSRGPGLPVFVNDVSFTEYHLFRGETRILP